MSVIARDNPEKKLDFNVVKEKLGTNIELTAEQILTLNSPDSSYLCPNIAITKLTQSCILNFLIIPKY